MYMPDVGSEEAIAIVVSLAGIEQEEDQHVTHAPRDALTFAIHVHIHIHI